MNSQPNVDSSEIAKFDAIASDWWNLQGSFKPLHEINPIRLQFIQQNIDLKNKKVIDIGCGGGILTESIAKAGAEVVGIDLSEQAITTAKLHAKSNSLNIDYQCIAAEAIANTHAHQFDAVTCMELLEHVPDPAAIIAACAKLVKPSGKLFFSTINRNLKSYLFAIVGAEYLLKLIPKGTHDYEKFIRPSEFESWARSADLRVKELKGMSYNPLTKIYQLTSDVNVNYLVYCEPNS